MSAEFVVFTSTKREYHNAHVPQFFRPWNLQKMIGAFVSFLVKPKKMISYGRNIPPFVLLSYYVGF